MKVGTTKDALSLIVGALEDHRISLDEAIDGFKGLLVLLEVIEMDLFKTFKQVFELDEYRTSELEMKSSKNKKGK